MKYLVLILISVFINSCSTINQFTSPIKETFKERFQRINEEDIVELSAKLENDPNNVEVLSKIALFHKKNNDCKSFNNIYQHLKTRANFEVSNHLELNNFEAKCKINNLALKEANNILQNTLKYDASNAEALTYIGLIFTLTNKLDEAEIYQNYALEQDGGNYIILNNAGILAMYQKDYHKAYHWFEAAFYLADKEQKLKLLNNLLNAMVLANKDNEARLLVVKYYDIEQQGAILHELGKLKKSGFKPAAISYK